MYVDRAEKLWSHIPRMLSHQRYHCLIGSFPISYQKRQTKKTRSRSCPLRKASFKTTTLNSTPPSSHHQHHFFINYWQTWLSHRELPFRFSWFLPSSLPCWLKVPKLAKVQRSLTRYLLSPLQAGIQSCFYYVDSESFSLIIFELLIDFYRFTLTSHMATNPWAVS